MRRTICLFLAMGLAIFGDARAGAAANATPTAAQSAHKCLFPNTRKRAPNWVCAPQGGGLALAAVGSSPRSGAGIAFMEQMAATDARVHLARKMEPALQHRVATRQRAGPGAVRARQDVLMRLTDESLRDARIVKRAYAPDGTLYVLVGLDALQAHEKIDSVSSAYLARMRR